MVTRTPALERIAEHTGETVVAVENFSRVLTRAPAPYCTGIGRGRSGLHVSAQWLVATYLAVALGDHKNAASLVPAFGSFNLIEPLHLRTYQQIRDSASSEPVWEAVRTDELVLVDDDFGLRPTLFETLVSAVSEVAGNPDGVIGQRVKAGFEAKLDLTTPRAQIELHFAAGVSMWSRAHAIYQPEHIAPQMIQRNVVFGIEAVEMLAGLYADTIRHEAAADASIREARTPETKETVEAPTPTVSLHGQPARVQTSPLNTETDTPTHPPAATPGGRPGRSHPSIRAGDRHGDITHAPG